MAKSCQACQFRSVVAEFNESDLRNGQRVKRRVEHSLCQACAKFYRRYRTRFDYIDLKNHTQHSAFAKCRLCRFMLCLEALKQDDYYDEYRRPNCFDQNVHQQADCKPNSSADCKVCGLPSYGTYFGVLCCQGCKCFFQRTIEGKYTLDYVCKGNSLNKCSIESGCRKCRLDRCLEAGMSSNQLPKSGTSNFPGSLEEAGTSSSMETDEEIPGGEQPFIVQVASEVLSTSQVVNTAEKMEWLFNNDTDEANKIIILQLIEASTKLLEIVNENSHNIQNWETGIRKPLVRYFQPISKFIKILPGADLLSHQDQTKLLVTSFYQIIMAQMALSYNMEVKLPHNLSFASAETISGVRKFFSWVDVVLEELEECANKQKIAVGDVNEFGILCAVLFLNPECKGLENSALVRKLNTRYMAILLIHERCTNVGLVEQKMISFFSMLQHYQSHIVKEGDGEIAHRIAAIDVMVPLCVQCQIQNSNSDQNQ